MGNLSLFFERLSFTARYMTALSLIALLSTLAFFNLNHLLLEQLNQAAQVCLEEAEAKTKNLSRLEVYIYIVTLVALFLDPQMPVLI